MAGEIFNAPDNLKYPRDYKSEGVAGGGAPTEGQGKDSIQKLGSGQIYNNEGQGTGIAGPSEWGGCSWPTPKSSAEAGTKVSADYSVDLTSGQNSCWNGAKPYKG